MMLLFVWFSCDVGCQSLCYEDVYSFLWPCVGCGVVRIDSLCLLARGHKRRPNLDLVFFVFTLCCNVFLFLVNVCLCYVSFSFSVLSQEIGWEERL